MDFDLEAVLSKCQLFKIHNSFISKDTNMMFSLY